MINKPIIYMFSKDFTNHSKKTNRKIVFRSRLFINILENKTSSDIYWGVQLVCLKVQNHSFLDTPQKYIQDQIPLMNQGLFYPQDIVCFTAMGIRKKCDSNFLIFFRHKGQIQQHYDSKSFCQELVISGVSMIKQCIINNSKNKHRKP